LSANKLYQKERIGRTNHVAFGGTICSFTSVAFSNTSQSVLAIFNYLGCMLDKKALLPKGKRAHTAQQVLSNRSIDCPGIEQQAKQRR